jgi:hypothetical protein
MGRRNGVGILYHLLTHHGVEAREILTLPVTPPPIRLGGVQNGLQPLLRLGHQAITYGCFKSLDRRYHLLSYFELTRITCADHGNQTPMPLPSDPWSRQGGTHAQNQGELRGGFFDHILV